MHSVVLIPARYASSRFPGKPLVSLLGKPMVIWVAELSAKAVGVENVYVVTDDERIVNVVHGAGFKSIMTSISALTGTDRLAEAAQKVDADIYINVQGDEPLVCPQDILKAIKEKQKTPNMIINGFCWISADEDPYCVNIPKVITNEKEELIYISRCALPGFKNEKEAPSKYKKQVCIYAFTKQELSEFLRFGRKSELELYEDIEILRFFELGKKIRMYQTKQGSLAVDVPEDIVKVEAALREKLDKTN